MESNQSLEQLRDLLEQLSVGEADSDTLERISTLLRENEELRTYAARHLMDDSLLRLISQTAAATDLYRDSQLFPQAVTDQSSEVRREPKPTGHTDHKRSFLVLMTTLAAGLLLGAFIYSWKQNKQSVPHVASELNTEETADLQDPNAVPEDSLFAVLTQSVDTVWTGAERKPGYMFGAEKIEIQQGLLQLEFFSGATLVLEGPAELEISSPLNAVCRRGKTRVFAPPQASGFTIVTPGMDVVDLGTEFAVEVDEGGQSQVHVLDGEVSLRNRRSGRPKSGPIQMLKGRSARFTADVESSLTLAETPTQIEDRFIGSQRLSELAAVGGLQRMKNWQDHSEILRSDPATILYCDFQHPNGWSRLLPIQSSLITKSLDGAIVGARWREGRWPGKSALDFKGTSDRVRLNIPGEYDSVTFVAWLRVDEITQKRNSILLTDGWESGEVHWQIDGAGQLILGVSDDLGDTFAKGKKIGKAYRGPSYTSPPLLSLEDMQRWVCMATVFDSKAREVRHYFDGERKSADPLQAELRKVRFGAAEIGNWSPSTQKHFLTRGFHGRIDELAVLARVLSDVEIESIYKIGRP